MRTYWRLFARVFACVCVPFSKFHSTSESGKSFDTNFTPVESTTLAMSAVLLEFLLRPSAEELRTNKPTPVQTKPSTSLAAVKDSLAPGKARFVHFNRQGSREDQTIRPKLVRRSLEEIGRSKPSPRKRQAEFSHLCQRPYKATLSQSSSRLACKHPIVHCCTRRSGDNRTRPETRVGGSIGQVLASSTRACTMHMHL